MHRRLRTLGVQRASGWSWLCPSLLAREARDAFGVAGPSGARETGFGAGDPPGLGKRNASRARIVTGLRPRAPARQGRTLRGRYGACWRSPGCAGAGEADRPPAEPARSGWPPRACTRPPCGRRLARPAPPDLHPPPRPTPRARPSGCGRVPYGRAWADCQNTTRTLCRLRYGLSRRPRPCAGDPRLLTLRFHGGDSRDRPGHDGCRRDRARICMN